MSIVNRSTGGMEISSANPKYDIMTFNTELNAWTKIGVCMTLAEGRELAEQRLSE